MMIGGRVFRTKNISVDTETKFSTKYKKHYIEVAFHKQEGNNNPEWSVDVWHFDGTYAVETIVQRCIIRDAIIYALNGALL